MPAGDLFTVYCHDCLSSRSGRRCRSCHDRTGGLVLAFLDGVDPGRSAHRRVSSRCLAVGLPQTMRNLSAGVVEFMRFSHSWTVLTSYRECLRIVHRSSSWMVGAMYLDPNVQAVDIHSQRVGHSPHAVRTGQVHLNSCSPCPYPYTSCAAWWSALVSSIGAGVGY